MLIDTSINTGCLANRITSNQKYSSCDLNEWIFSHIKITGWSNILELCCGTGSQTRYLIKGVEEFGHVVAVDISQDSLNTIRSTLTEDKLSHLSLVKSSIDNLDTTLPTIGITDQLKYFDYVFCSFGLYYSKNPYRVLDTVKKYMKAYSDIIIIGPYGDNNKNLFDFLELNGAKINDSIKYSCTRFMDDVVGLWAEKNAISCKRYTFANKITWNNKKQFMDYWENSTFYDKNLKTRMEIVLDDYLRVMDTFVNEKHIMMLEMKID